MITLGIETSCDDCSIALVRDGREIIAESNASQLRFHAEHGGVLPELAARKHIESILPVFDDLMERAARIDPSLSHSAINGIGVTNRPGLIGSLAVGLNFAKGLAFALDRPFIAVDHILAHIYAARMVNDIAYPHIALLVSGGHTAILVVEDFDRARVLGASIDDACGEAFDKVARHFGLGYPGGKCIDTLAKKGYARAFNFPFAKIRERGSGRSSPKGRNYDVSYSGLKNAVINQREKFWDGKSEQSIANIVASFQRVAIDSVLRKLDDVLRDTGLRRIVAGGGVVGNSYLRSALSAREHCEVYLPPLALCTDNGSMVAGLAYQYLKRGQQSAFSEGLQSRVADYRHQN